MAEQQQATPVERDAELAAAAQAALEWHAQAPEFAVHVDVREGWATLSGEVELNVQRQSAERAVRCVDGLAGVINCIRLKHPVLAADVHAAIADGLSRRAQEVARGLEVAVDGTRVTLRGRMHSNSEREAAEKAVLGIPEVTATVNGIEVLP